jgi:hypothetical protein
VATLGVDEDGVVETLGVEAVGVAVEWVVGVA